MKLTHPPGEPKTPMDSCRATWIPDLMNRFNGSSLFLSFLLLALLFNYDFLAGPFALVRFHDAFDTEYINLLARGKLFLENGFYNWYPHFAGGMPSFAERVPPYYLPSVVSSIIPIWLVYMIWRVGLMALAGYGMFRMLTGFFRVSHPIALFGGIFFALYRPSYVHTVFDYAFPIFFVWAAELHETEINASAKVLRIIALVGLMLISYPIITIQSYPIYHFMIVVFFGLGRKNAREHLIGTVLIWTGFVLFFTPQIFRLFEYVPFAHRDFITPFAQESMIPLNLSGILEVCKDFGTKFVNSAFLLNPMFLYMIFGLPLLRHSRRFRLACVLLLLPSVVHAVFASKMVVLLSGTFLIKMDLVHFHMVNIVSNSLVAVITLEEMRSSSLGRIGRQAAVAVIALAMLSIRPMNPVGLFVDITVVQLICFAFGMSVLLIVKRDEFPGILSLSSRSISMVLIIFFGAGLAGVGMLAKHPSNLVQPYKRSYGNHQELAQIAQENRSEVFRVGCAGVHPTVPLYYGLETAGQRGALFNKYYKEFVKTLVMPQLKDPEYEKAFDAYWYDVLFTPFPGKAFSDPSGYWNVPLLLMANVKYLISDRPMAGIEQYADLYGQTNGEGLPFTFLKRSGLNRYFTLPLWIYRFRGTFPRGYLATMPVISEKRDEVLGNLSKQTVEDLKKKVFFYSEGVPSLTRPERASALRYTEEGIVKIVDYSPDRIIFEGAAPSPCFLVITNNYDPKWSAVLNNNNVPVYRANHAFQAVSIDRAGPFRVVMEYRETTIWWLHIVTFIGLALFFVCGFGWKKTGGSFPVGTGGPGEMNPASRRVPFDGTGEDNRMVLPAMILTGLGMAVLHLVWALFLFEPNPGWSAQTVKGILAYNVSIVPLAGILVNLWAVTIVKKW